MKQALIAALLVFATTLHGSGQQGALDKSGNSGELFDAISRMDGVLFSAFNAHEVKRLMTMFTNDLESTTIAGGSLISDRRATTSPRCSGARPIFGESSSPGAWRCIRSKITARSNLGSIAFVTRKMEKRNVALSGLRWCGESPVACGKSHACLAMGTRTPIAAGFRI